MSVMMYNGVKRHNRKKMHMAADTLKRLKLPLLTKVIIGDKVETAYDLQLNIAKLPEVKEGFVLLPHRWMARDYDRLPGMAFGL